MADAIIASPVPIPEQLLRDLSRDLNGIVPNFADTEATLGVKKLHEIAGPLLDTANTADLPPSHRAAAYNLICAVIDRCQSSPTQYARDALLDDSIWTRLFHIYLTRSDTAKSKSIRQVLLTLTNVVLKNPGVRSSELQTKAVVAFLDVICERQDRLRVKPSLQGLAHFLQKAVVSPGRLVEIYADLLQRSSNQDVQAASFQSLFAAFLMWIVHHDTALSAGHVVRNFLTQYRQSLQRVESGQNPFPFWIEPTVETLRVWPDRIQEFKTHVFPYCFQPNLSEYLQFLSFLQFHRYVTVPGDLPSELRPLHSEKSDRPQHDGEEFRMLLAAIESGKELGIVVDIDYRFDNSVVIQQNRIQLPDSIFGGWLSHPDLEVRLAGLYLSIVSSAATRPVTGGIFGSLRRNIAHLHADSDANFRRELLSYIQKLFDRLRGSTATLARQDAKTKTGTHERMPFPKEATNSSSLSQDSRSQDLLLDSLRFIVWYLRVLEWDLRLEASYQRRITAVRALIVVLKSGIDPRVPRHLLSKGAQGQLGWVHGLSIPNPKLIRSLLELVLDPFDDIREASVSALQLCLAASSDDDRRAALAKLPGFINRAEAMMLRTGRADQADGVARAYSLYFSCSTEAPATDTGLQSGITSKLAILTHLTSQLKTTLEIASKNLSEAVNGRPVHGTFAAIRYIIDQDTFYNELETLSKDEFTLWRDIHSEVLGMIPWLWECVWNILCADAPEGHVPEDLEEESLGTKEILSYSWRGLKEASVLLRVIITRCPIREEENALLDVVQVEKLGNLCFNQLVELRHRGAFSTVAQTFGALCRRCTNADDPTLRALPQRFYMDTLQTIQAKSDTITRRSGGLPALMTGIVAAESQPGGKMFARAMRDLVVEASKDAESSNIEESRLPQVHSLNCIKDFFMSSRLSVASEAYLGEGLELAAKTLNSRIWPIRNCSLMLFKALIERLLGSDEAQDWKEREGVRTSRFSYGSYPSLIGILQSLLDPEGPLKELMNTPNSNSPMDLHGAEGVFPALQILRQAPPPEENRAAILKSVERLLGSPHWHMRDMAARTATILHHQNEYQQTIKTFLEYNEQSTNTRHGLLLCSRYMLKRQLQAAAKLHQRSFETASSKQAPQMLVEMMEILSDATERHMPHACPLIRGAFLDLVSLCGMAMLDMPTTEAVDTAWARLTGRVSIGNEYDLAVYSGPESSLFRQSVAKAFFVDRVRHQVMEPTVALNQGIGDALVFLAEEDVDTCLASLETLNEAFQLKMPRESTAEIDPYVFRLMLEASDSEVITKAQTILADSLSPSHLFSLSEEAAPSVLDKLQHQCCDIAPIAPSHMRSALRLLGYFLDRTWHIYPSLPFSDRITNYARLLRVAILDTNTFDHRFAAVQSIASLRHLWAMDRTASPTSDLILRLAFPLYDLLNDDDEEIRETASAATMCFIHPLSDADTAAETNTHVPLLTTHHLATFLVKNFSKHVHLHREAVRRITLYPPTSTSTSLVPFATTLNALLSPTPAADALFATEKQNLYLDLTLDAVFWSRILASIPRSSVPAKLRWQFGEWVRDALATLVDTIRREKDGDEALGWTSRANGDVSSLGIRVLAAADVVLRWGGGDEDRCKEQAQEVSRLVGVVAGGDGVHVLWKERAEEVLEGYVLRLLRGISGVADGLGFGL